MLAHDRRSAYPTPPFAPRPEAPFPGSGSVSFLSPLQSTPRRAILTHAQKTPGGFNQTAFQVVCESTGQAPKLEDEPEPVKNPAAVALGRLGGLKGGKARAASLSHSKSSAAAAAAKAAKSRWGQKRR